MGFLAGTMLWGALAAGIPVILHLTGRAKPVLHRFAALRFLHRSHKTTSRALRIKHLLLLLLRIFAIVLLAVTLARPVWPWSSPAALPGQLHGDYVLVLDASLSMACRAGETSRFERAQAQAGALLDLLAPGARVALAVAAEEAESVQGRLTLDHARVREAVASAEAGGQALDLGRALRAAQAIFQRESRPEQEGAARAVVFFTDLQANAFAAAARGSLGEDAELPPLVIVDVGEGEERNAAVLAAEMPQYAVAAGQALVLSATVKPLATDRTCVVDLFVDDVRIAQKPLEPEGAASVDVRFDFPAGLPGVHAGRLRIVQHDALAADQERAFAYDAGRPPRTLIVERPAEGEGTLGSGHFLRAALATPSAGAASGLEAEVVAAKDVKTDQFKDHRVVILADPGDLSDAVWRALQRFVQDGGGLFVWLGPNCNPEALAPMAYSTYSRNLGLLPGHLGKQIALPADKPQTVRIEQPDHPVLARFTPQVRGVLRAVRVKQYVSVEPEAADPNAGVVLALSGGAPLLLEKSYGTGRVLLCATGPTAASSSMVVQGEAEALLTLVLDACRLLSGGGDETRARLGRPLALTIFDPPADGVVRWTPPGATRPGTLYTEPDAPSAEAKAAAKASEKPGSAAPARRAKLLVPPLKAAGVHRFAWRPAGQSADREQLVAVNSASSESDLARIADAAALEALKPWAASIVREVAQAPRFAAKSAEGREWPIPLLLAVLALLAVESFLSNRLYRGSSVDGEAEGGADGAP